MTGSQIKSAGQTNLTSKQKHKSTNTKQNQSLWEKSGFRNKKEDGRNVLLVFRRIYLAWNPVIESVRLKDGCHATPPQSSFTDSLILQCRYRDIVASISLTSQQAVRNWSSSQRRRNEKMLQAICKVVFGERCLGKFGPVRSLLSKAKVRRDTTPSFSRMMHKQIDKSTTCNSVASGRR